MSNQNKIILSIIAVMAMLTPMSMDIYLPALGQVVKDLHTHYEPAQLTISIFVLGIAVMQLFWGPISDHFGRRKTLFFGLGLFLVANFACIIAHNIFVLIVARFFQAAGGCIGAITAYAMIRDQYTGPEAGKLISIITGCMALAPVIAPIIGAYLAEYFGWRSCFVFVFILGLLLLLASIKFLEETRGRSEKKFSFKSTLGNYLGLLNHKHFLLYTTCIVLAFAGIFSFIANSPEYLINHLQTSMKLYSYLFALNALALVLGNLTVHQFISKKGVNYLIKLGGVILLLSGFIMVMLDIFIGYTIWTLMLPMFFASFGIALILPSSIAGLLIPFKETAGTATSLATSLRFIIGAAIAIIIGFSMGWHQWPLAILLIVTGFIVWSLMQQAI